MSSPVRDAIVGYVAGRVRAEQLAITLATAYYRETGNAQREALRPLLEIIDRASPGIVELGGTADGPGFEVRLAERPFPKPFEAELRRAAEAYLASERTTGVLGVQPRPPRPAPAPGVLARFMGMLRRLFGTGGDSK